MSLLFKKSFFIIRVSLFLLPLGLFSQKDKSGVGTPDMAPNPSTTIEMMEPYISKKEAIYSPNGDYKLMEGSRVVVKGHHINRVKN